MTEGLQPILGCEAPNRRADVVFVHGLGGNPTATWHPKGHPESFWPRWLGEDFSEIGVWTFGYDASVSNWFGDAMPITDRATNALEHLRVDGLAGKPLIFITHSLGGLLVKRMLRQAHDTKSNVLARTLGVVFLATPHTGAGLASYARWLPRAGRLSTLVYELTAASPELRDLNSWYRNHWRELRIGTKVFTEKRNIGPFRIVREDSSDPGLEGVAAIPTPETHFSICKPTSRDSFVYKSVREFIRELLEEPQLANHSATVDSTDVTKPMHHAGLGSASIPSNSAVDLWQKKLAYFRKEEALAVDPATKFRLRKQIEECREKIRDFGGRA